MLGLGTIGQFTIGQVGTGTAEVISPDKWFVALSEPVRFRPGLRAGLQQFAALSDPFPFVSFSWFEELSIPALRSRRGLNAGQQQFEAYSPNPTTVTPFGWFIPLTEPTRFRRGLKAGEIQFSAQDTQVIPINIMAWDVPLAEPVRFRRGLRAPWQQFSGAPVQLRPNPNITAILHATETKDALLASVSVFNRPNSAEIGIIDTSFPAAEIGVSPTFGGGPIASVSISISII